MIAPPNAVVLIPPDITTIGMLRDLVRFEQLQAEHLDYELFIVVFKNCERKAPGGPFAIVMRIRKDVAHIQDRWPALVSYSTRVVTLEEPGPPGYPIRGAYEGWVPPPLPAEEQPLHPRRPDPR